MIRVGDSWHTESVVATREAMVEFARSYDPQPMHVDTKAADQSFFEELVASGWFTLSTTMRLAVLARPFGERPLIGLGVADIRFLRPVRPGDSLSATLTVTGIAPLGSSGRRRVVTLDVVTVTARDAVLRQQWSVLHPEDV